ncbi:nuclear transport factor 2 family protein [Terrimonas sp. NA20]|uniref:Nuclear transport factor 2 family protein n=1 Tax=Terrimonas ginsenosidimutans TaxID=2908004 RepID=A0ABS9KSC7_9BACT|nr:nuclear transport factor 2 family protein [Terrimonas ginsenosidimutans]MCG2615237.1 nuclear transport factor 2 family protein [Terrimonas ginsenosidimutans]
MSTKQTNEEIIRHLYEVAEIQDSKQFATLFADDGYFWDVSADKKYYGKDTGMVVDIYAKAFPDMHRELLRVYPADAQNMVMVELTLNGTHNGPLQLPTGVIEATGRKINTPCADFFLVEDGKVKFFHCYTAATILLKQIGALG